MEKLKQDEGKSKWTKHCEEFLLNNYKEIGIFAAL